MSVPDYLTVTSDRFSSANTARGTFREPCGGVS